jgi:hypothetical protein
MSEIVISHDVNQALTTSYHQHLPESSQQQHKREAAAAMAKAERITSHYSHLLIATTPTKSSGSQLRTSVPLQFAASPPPAAPSPPKGQMLPRRSIEPGALALSDSIRGRSFSSLASSNDEKNNSSRNIVNNSSHDSVLIGDLASPPPAPPPPPPLTTEVSELMFMPKEEQPYALEDNNLAPASQYQHIDEWTAAVTDQVTSSSHPSDFVQLNSAMKSPPTLQLESHQGLEGQLSGNVTAENKPNNSYLNLPSVHSNGNNLETPRQSDTGLVPTTDANKHASILNRTTSLPILVSEKQLRLLQEIQENSSSSTTKVPMMNNNNHGQYQNEQDLAILEQEKLWHELTDKNNRRQPQVTQITPSSTIASAQRRSALEEQTRLWEQIQCEQRQNSQGPLLHHNLGIPTSMSNTPQAAISPIEEQARLLEQFQRARRSTALNSNTTITSTVAATLEAQDRMLRALSCTPASYQPGSHSPSSVPSTIIIDAFQEQVNRLREIQDEKDRQFVEMAKRLSCAPEAHQQPTATLASAEYDMALEEVIEISRRDADEAQVNAELLDAQALRVALLNSAGEELRTAMGDFGGDPVVASLVLDADVTPVEGAPSDLDIGRSSAESTCPSPDQALDGEQPPRAPIAFPTPANRRRRWGFGSRRKSSR